MSRAKSPPAAGLPALLPRLGRGSSRLACALLSVAAAAQTGTTPPGPGQPPGVVEWPPHAFPQGQAPQGQPQQQPFQFTQREPGAPLSGFPGIQTTLPDFRGFPLVGPGRIGFGAYPGFTPPENLQDLVPPAGALRPPGLWPSWLAPGRPDAESQARFDRAVLVRSSDRVWYRAAEESVYVPLPFFDKVREMEAGAGVQVRTGSGALMLLYHDGATWRSLGQIDLQVRTLSEAVAEMDLRDLHRIWVLGKRRPFRLHLPDGSVFELMDTHVYLARDGERVVVRNYGPAAAKVTSPLGTVDLPANHQVLLLMSPVPEERASTALALQGSVRAQAEGRVLAIDGGSDGGAVDWLGARVRLGSNQRATIDPLAGTAFPEYRPAAGKVSSAAGPAGAVDGRH
jgi:hypothetical protein